MEHIEWITRITWTDGLIALGIFLVFFFLRRLFTAYFLKLLTKLSHLSKSRLDDALIESFRKPIAFFLLLTGIYLSLTYLPLPASWESTVTLLYKSTTVFSIGWGFYLFADATGLFFSHMNDRFNMKFNEIIVPFLSRILKFVIVVLTIFLILEQWNFHVSGLIAGLGIGGLAVAMAAKDTLSNLFGGFVLITDAPFTIGDIIQSGTIEGTVEDISFRSTRIRTIDRSLITVPNATLANQPITNLSKLEKRRVLIHIPLNLETSSSRLKKCRSRIREMLSADPIVFPEDISVHIDSITSSGINLLIQFYVRTTDYGEWMDIRERFNLTILELLNDEGVSFAAVRSQWLVAPKEEQRESADENPSVPSSRNGQTSHAEAEEQQKGSRFQSRD
ncbi:mechanosensitive ion channel family protein [Sporolactobacillus sp. THM7-7]|nr:mechanosensitive ion channel family protein [Sporolactobacillus sp. THM7-7]